MTRLYLQASSLASKAFWVCTVWSPPHRQTEWPYFWGGDRLAVVILGGGFTAVGAALSLLVF